ncbi:MAG: SDR family NAD(P)-dependent oxidoreductase [Deltaproteobacteria bacterium]|nr:SDR family NAD(P)-dependent oxidoreductase [Deltaproteobacteria bacterium]
MINRPLTAPIAVIGMACWYPDARNPRQLWENILARRRQFRQLPDQRFSIADYYHPDSSEPDKTYLAHAAVIDGFNFDWASKRIPYNTFQSTDIVHWLALETAIKAITDAGYSRDDLPGERTGVIVGNSLTGEITRSNTMRLRWPYVRRAFRAAARSRNLSDNQAAKIETTLKDCYNSVFPSTNEDTLAGGLSNTIAGRICNFLNLCGGGYTVDGACSSSLIAVATAATGLTNKDLNLAIAGGVDISLDPFELVGFAKTGALTKDDMNVYDRRGGGFIPGEGCGFVVLKRLDDARRDKDYIYAILHGWGISSDGRGTAITAPNATGQAKALKRAYARAPYGIEDLNFLEGHGTGTAIGDRSELEGIALAMKNVRVSQKKLERSCGITSLKSIIGHTKAASGVGGFIKAVMGVNRRILPPTAGCRDLHPLFNTMAHSLYPILQGKQRKPTEILRAGVSAMGFGGINCHVTLESGDPPSDLLEPSMDERSMMVSSQETEIFVLTAETMNELYEKVNDLIRISKGISIAELTDLAAKLGHEAYRKASVRSAVIAGKPDELTKLLEQLASMVKESSPPKGEMLNAPGQMVWLSNRFAKTRVGMLFPGQGSQKLNMARVLIERFQWARDRVREADQWIEDAGGRPISRIIYPPLDQAGGPEDVEAWFHGLSQTENAQPAICLASQLWFQFLQKLGVTPVALGGHSLGELTAFHAAGAFDFHTLIRLATARGHAMTVSGDQKEGMASLLCSEEKAKGILEQTSGYIVLANINSPRQIVLSGEQTALEMAIKIAAKEGIMARQLKVSNAFHSELASHAVKVMEDIEFLPERLAVIRTSLFSSTDGEEVKQGISLRKHFAGQILSQVNFVNMIRSMAKNCNLFIEVGPGRVLSGLVNDIMGDSSHVCIPIESSPFMDKDMNRLLASLFIRGIDIDWHKLYEKRLVRPFVPPSERLFIQNPCERPFDLSPADEASFCHSLPEKAQDMLSGIVNLSSNELEAYLETRGPFLAEFIQADMKYSVPFIDKKGEADTEIEVEKIKPSVETKAHDVSTPALKSKTVTREEMTSVLFSLVKDITGYPVDSLLPEMRLLDDLNLDSIKAVDLVMKAAKKTGLENEVDLAGNANATLSEIVDKMMGYAKKRAPDSIEPKKPNVLKIVLEQTSLITGYPEDVLNADALVEHDLNIGLDMLNRLVRGLASALNIEIHVDLEPLLQRSLRQIAEILERIVPDGTKKQTMDVDGGPDPWVREFKVVLAEEPLQLLPEWLGKRKEDDWQSANALILTTPDSADVATSLRNRLFGRGAQVQIATFKEAHNKGLAKNPGYSHLIAILPRTGQEYNSDKEQLQDIVEHLSSVTSPPQASHAPRRRTTVAYIQFGGGYFGDHPVFSHINRCCALALAASLHLERDDLRVRVIDLSTALDAEKIADKVIEEINTPAPFAAAGFDFELKRSIAMPELMQPASYKPRSMNWSTKDVILVTGGARGITASCAFGLALETGARMAIIGRSAHPDTAPDRPSSREIAETLKMYNDRKLFARYFSCDVSDRESLISVVREIRRDMGQITGVIHGAGLNHPRLLSQVSVEDALQEISPKLMGALNLVFALKDAPPKLFVGISSIVGVTGMPGNAWYGFSNEALDLVLRRFAADHPDTDSLSIAYSIWQDEGMGARMGSVENLHKMGIRAIPSREGVQRFIRLFLNDPGVHKVIVAGRLGSLDTLVFGATPTPEGAKFLETPLHFTPGVETVFQTHLIMEENPYLKDHIFNGSYLFPAVFGLEAMAQAVAHITGKNDLGRVRIEDVKLDRPITVDPQDGANIVVWAEAQEYEPESTVRKIRAGISKSRSRIKSDFFSATFILGLTDKQPKYAINIPDMPLEIKPRLDLYREDLLFQGPRFQRIDKVWNISATGENGKDAIFSSKLQDLGQAAEDAFTDPLHRALFLGDPFLRDSLLQSTYMLVPKKICLPLYIGSIDIYPCTGNTHAFIMGYVQMDRIEEDKVKNNVVMVDSDGNVRERLEGYALRILNHLDDYPGADDLVIPEKRDNRIVRDAMNRVGGSMKIKLPEILLKYITGIHDMSREKRRSLEIPMLNEVIFHATGKGYDSYEIKWLKSGEPVIVGLKEDETKVSLSHDERICLCIAGYGAQGCNIAPIIHRNRQEWQEIIGSYRDDLLDRLINDHDTLDLAGTRIRAAMEVLQKVTGKNDTSLEIVYRDADAVLFKSIVTDGSLLILTFHVDLTRGPERIIAIVAKEAKRRSAEPLPSKVSGYEEITKKRHFELIKGGPQGQDVFIQRFPVTFRPNAQLSRTLYFSNYFFWLGEVREAGVWPVLGKVAQQFPTSKCGMVTNYTKAQILGEATAGDQIEVRLWFSGNHGPADSTMDVNFDFRKMLKNGDYERLAWCKHQATWVKILDHGIVKPEPYPDYYREFVFMSGMLPRYDAPNLPDPLPEPLSGIVKQIKGEKEAYISSGPIVRPVLSEQIIDTSLDNSNLVGNIYFANYYVWQGQIRDRYFFGLIPEYYRGTGRDGELLCLETRVNHLREAMPFDRIMVTMALRELKRQSAIFYFEYFLMDANNKRVKLAFGEQNAVWVKRDPDGKPVPAPFPAVVQEALHNAISKK